MSLNFVVKVLLLLSDHITFGPHEQHLPRAVGFRDDQRHAAGRRCFLLVHGENFAAGRGPFDGGIPMEARKRAPDVGVGLIRVGQFCQQAALSRRS